MKTLYHGKRSVPREVNGGKLLESSSKLAPKIRDKCQPLLSRVDETRSQLVVAKGKLIEAHPGIKDNGDEALAHIVGVSLGTGPVEMKITFDGKPTGAIEFNLGEFSQLAGDSGISARMGGWDSDVMQGTDSVTAQTNLFLLNAKVTELDHSLAELDAAITKATQEKTTKPARPSLVETLVESLCNRVDRMLGISDNSADDVRTRLQSDVESAVTKIQHVLDNCNRNLESLAN